MSNHVLRDRIWDSTKLCRCTRDAALAYPWILLVADDWGRFEYAPRRIWSKVFGARQDIPFEETQKWLDEYEATGLMVRYRDGELAFWTGFVGRPPSQRRESLYPVPPTEGLGDGYVAPTQVLPTSDIDQIGIHHNGRPRRLRLSAVSTNGDRADARSLIDAYNEIFAARISYSPGNLRAAVRALDEGYTEAHCRTVFEAVRDQTTETAGWCHSANREFEFLVRPQYRQHRTGELIFGPLDKIPNELATGRKKG